MISFTGFVLISILGLVLYHFFLRHDGKKSPTGPFALPILGNALQLRGNVGETLMSWWEKFGDIYVMYFGNNRCFVINDLKLAKEVFNDNKFSARPNNELFSSFSDGLPVGVLNSSGQVWVEQRRFTLRHLRDFGFGKRDGEEMIVEEVKEFLDTLATKTGQPTVINKTFQMAVLNTLWQILAAVRYQQDDPRLWSIFNQNQKLLQLLSKNPFLLFAPKIAKALPTLLGWNAVINIIDEMKTIVYGHMDHHRKSMPVDGASRDFIDSYIKEIDSTKDVRSSFYDKAGHQNMAAVIADLFGAGFDTVTTAVSFTVLYLTKYPEIQKKVQVEMDHVVGRNRFPSTADRPSLPYTEAVIAETMRLGTLAPIGLFHGVAEDTKIRDFDVPKDSWVIAPLYVYHHDEKYFPNPKQFKPERFLTPDGKKFQKHEAFVPFSFGKRVCLGETLAREEVFLFVTHLFHRFSVRAAGDPTEINAEPTDGVFVSSRDYECVLTERT